MNDIPIKFEFDSGASCSTISKSDADRIGAKITPSKKKIVAYGGNDVTVLGEVLVSVKCFDKVFQQKFVVIKKCIINLFGRDMAQKLQMKIVVPDNSIHKLSTEISDEFSSFLSDDFKSSVSNEVDFSVEDGTKPIFSKARAVPIRYNLILLPNKNFDNLVQQ